jgi:hypothetical protein
MHFDAKVRYLAQEYRDGTPRLEIWVTKSQANGLPFEDGRKVPIRLRVADREYEAGLHATLRNRYVWLSPVVHDGRQEMKLAKVLTDAGFRANDSIRLTVSGSIIEVRPR